MAARTTNDSIRSDVASQSEIRKARLNGRPLDDDACGHYRSCGPVFKELWDTRSDRIGNCLGYGRMACLLHRESSIRLRAWTQASSRSWEGHSGMDFLPLGEWSPGRNRRRMARHGELWERPPDGWHRDDVRVDVFSTPAFVTPRQPVWNWTARLGNRTRVFLTDLDLEMDAPLNEIPRRTRSVRSGQAEGRASRPMAGGRHDRSHRPARSGRGLRFPVRGNRQGD